MNHLESVMVAAGIYRDLLSYYQRKVNEEVKENKDFVIPVDEYKVYLLLHDIVVSWMLLLDKLSLFDREYLSYERFRFQGDSDVSSEL